MRKVYALPLAVALAALAGGCAGRDQTCRELEAARKQIYGFRPTRLAPTDREGKHQAMDRFWELARGQGSRGVECLRRFVLQEENDPFFSFDASSLLYSLDQSASSLEAVLVGLSRTDLGELNSAGYIRLLMELSKQGVDIGPLAEKYLRSPAVSGYVPAHAMPLDRETGALFLYGVMAPELADRYLIAALQAKEPFVRAVAAQLLSLSLTEESFKALKSLGDMPGFSAPVRERIVWALKRSAVPRRSQTKYSREQVLHRLKHLPDYDPSLPEVSGNEEFETSAIATLGESDLRILREARMTVLVGVSDEALHEYFALTRIMLGIVNRLDLYKQYRKD